MAGFRSRGARRSAAATSRSTAPSRRAAAVGPGFDDAAALEDVDPVGVQDGREPVRDQDGDRVAGRRHVADRVDDPFLGERVERRGRLVEHEQVRMAQQRARDRQPLLLAARDLHAAFADHRVEAPVGARQQAVARRLAQHVEALGVGRRRVHEQQVLADRAGEELRVLGDEADPLAQRVEIDLVAGDAVVEDPPGLRAVEPDQQLHQRRLARRPTARRTRSSRRARRRTRCR